MGGLPVFALLVVAAAAFYGGRAVLRRKEGLGPVGDRPALLVAVAVVLIGVLLALAVVAVTSLVLAPG